MIICLDQRKLINEIFIKTGGYGTTSRRQKEGDNEEIRMKRQYLPFFLVINC